MPTRIRLQRHGKKNSPFYSVVIADGRAPRDGRFIEKIGTYNPMTDPATINLNFDRAIYWLNCGAQPSDTARSILSKEGVMLKKHLLTGVRKGALTEDQAENKFQEWKTKKELDVNSYKNYKIQNSKANKKSTLDAEIKLKEQKAEEVNKKRLAAQKLNNKESEVVENQESIEVVENQEVIETETPSDIIAEETKE